MMLVMSVIVYTVFEGGRIENLLCCAIGGIGLGQEVIKQGCGASSKGDFKRRYRPSKILVVIFVYQA